MNVKKIFGPPGTGKTHALLDEFARRLRSGTLPNHVAFLTFTRAARDEAAARVDLPLAELPWLRTIHSACYRALSVDREQVIQPADLRKFGERIGASFTGNVRNPWLVDDALEDGRGTQTFDDQILQATHLARHRGVELSFVAPINVTSNYIRYLVNAYETWKKNDGLLDYTDLLVEYVRDGQPLDVDVAFIDEAQDLSWLQWQVVKKLSALATDLLIAGDDDQAIFSWAGASAKLFNDFRADETIVLPKSHRLPRRVYELSQSVITRVKERTPKRFEPRADEGEIRHVALNIPEDVVHGDVLVLFRNHHRASSLARQLNEFGVPFVGDGSVLSLRNVKEALSAWDAFSRGRSVSHEQARAVVALTNNEWLVPRAVESFRSSGGYVRWEMLLLRQPTLTNWSQALTRAPGLKLLERLEQRSNGLAALLNPSVRLMSIHQAKGREADTVIVDPTMARRSYEQLTSAANADEHRVWYVAVTRAKRRLVLLTAAESKGYKF